MAYNLNISKVLSHALDPHLFGKNMVNGKNSFLKILLLHVALKRNGRYI